MARPRGRPDPEVMLTHQAAMLLRKKRRIHGDFGINSIVIPKKESHEFIAHMMERDPREAEIPTISGEKTKNRRLQLTATGRWHHSIFRPYPEPWNKLNRGEQEKLYHYFKKAAQAHAAEKGESGNPRNWAALLLGKKILARNYAAEVMLGLEKFKRKNTGRNFKASVREAEKYFEGWMNLHSILEAITERAKREE